MKCITVKYLGPTDTKGARLAFYWNSEVKETVPRDHSVSFDKQAVTYVADEIEKTGEFVCVHWGYDYKGDLQIIVS